MSDMKFKFTIQPYQTEAVESVINVFAGQPFNDRFTYRRDAQIERDVTNWKMTDEELASSILILPENTASPHFLASVIIASLYAITYPPVVIIRFIIVSSDSRR